MTTRETNVTRGGPPGLKARVTEVGAAVDHRWPGLVRALAAARWGGLRTVHPDARTWTAVAGSGAAAGLGLRSIVGRTPLGRWVAPPVSASVAVGVAAAWLGLWRWDAARFTRTRVTLVPDLAPDALEDLATHLAGAGLVVEVWQGPARADGRGRGLICRVRDVREVNRRIDDWTAARGSAPEPGGARRRARPVV